MLYRLLLSIVIVFSIHGHAEAKAVIMGVVNNATMGERVELYVPHYYIDNSHDTWRTEIDGRQRFVMEVELPEAQATFLVIGEDRLALFLEPDDTLTIKTDYFQFPLSVQFGGRAGLNNRVLQEHLRFSPVDFNEFNNVRFKIGHWWFGVESAINDTMLVLQPPAFRAAQDRLKQAGFGLLDRHAGQLTPAFQLWLEAEVLYNWAYQLLMYGYVYRNRYGIESAFFDFLYESPVVCESIGSEAYRQFLLVLMARRQVQKETPAEFFQAQYEQSADFLSGKSLAFFQSEVIRMAFSAEQWAVAIPMYTRFLQSNPYPQYDLKVTALYEKSVRVAPGTYAPDFEATDVLGHAVSLKSLKGRVVYVNFWASWCSSCIAKMDVMNAYAPELEAANVEVLNISIDQNPERWVNTLTDHQFIGRHVLSTSETRLAALFGVEAVPQYFIVTPGGVFAEKPYSNQPADVKDFLVKMRK